jgi:hypothetical protein
MSYKNDFNRSCIFVKIFHYTKFQDLTLSGTSVAPTSEICTYIYVGDRELRSMKAEQSPMELYFVPIS